MTLASTQFSAYGEEVRTTLQVMTNQLGVALQNASMVKRLKEMAMHGLRHKPEGTTTPWWNY